MKKSNRKSKVAPKARAVAAPKGALIPLKKICADLGLETKPARVKLRRVWRRTDENGKPLDNLAFHKKGARWDLTAKDAKEVREILSN